MARTIDALLTDFNTKLEGRLSYSDMVFKNLAVLQPLDGITFPMERIEQREGRKISPFDERGLTFYHRIESEDVETIIGKGNSSYNRILYNMVIVGIGYRPNITTATTWNNEDIAQTVMNAIGQGMILDFKERVVVQGRPTTDKLTVLNEEYVGNPIMQEKVLDLIAFKIPYTLEVKQIYCDDATSPVTSVTVNPQEQAGSDGQPITQIDITANAPSLLEVSNLPSGLTFEVLSNTTAKITGNAPSSTEIITIIATGAAGGRIGSYASIEVGGATPVTGLTYSNDDQTIWAQSGTGSLTTMEPTTTPSNATGTYSSGDLPTGMALDTNTGFITVSDITLMPLGESTFTVTFTGSGSFSGSANYLVTVTRRELWTPLDLTDYNTRVIGFYDFSENGTLTIVDNRIEGITDRSNFSNDISQTSNTALLGEINGVRAALFILTDYIANLGVSSSDFNVFYKTNQAPATGEFLIARSNTDYVVRALNTDSGRFDQRIAGGSATTFSYGSDNAARSNTFGINFYTFNLYYSGSTTTRVRVDGGESYDSGDVSGGTLAFDFSTDFSIGSRGTPFGATSTGVFGYFLFINDSLTTAERQQIEGWDAHLYSTTDKLAAGHPYKTEPPFV